jgi:hypothetical protein
MTGWAWVGRDVAFNATRRFSVPVKRVLLYGAALALLEFQPPAASAEFFSEGETLVFDISWLGMNVGEASLDIRPDGFLGDRSVLRAVSTARSNDLIAYFFPVEDRIESLIDAEGLYSYSIVVNQRHGFRRVQKRVLFDQDNHRAELLYKGKTRMFQIPERVQDSLSSLYFFRTMEDLPVGQSAYIDVHESKKNWRLEIRILGREEVTVPLGRFKAIKTVARVRYEGVFMDKGDVIIWFSDDELRVPILMKGRVVIGSITATLTRRETGPSIRSGAREPD